MDTAAEGPILRLLAGGHTGPRPPASARSSRCTSFCAAAFGCCRQCSGGSGRGARGGREGGG